MSSESELEVKIYEFDAPDPRYYDDEDEDDNDDYVAVYCNEKDICPVLNIREDRNNCTIYLISEGKVNEIIHALESCKKYLKNKTESEVREAIRKGCNKNE